MHRIAPDNPVRRRLFSDEGVDEARVDNLANLLQETATSDKIAKMNKWNFDFENEIPLEGDYEWYRCDEGEDNDWVGIKVETKVDEDQGDKGDEGLLMKMENEVTPKSKDDEFAPLIRKRRKEEASASTDKSVKRRISF